MSSRFDQPFVYVRDPELPEPEPVTLSLEDGTWYEPEVLFHPMNPKVPKNHYFSYLSEPFSGRSSGPKYEYNKEVMGKAFTNL